MKIAIITLHRFDNVGSCLQACALSKYLSDRENQVLLLDYTPRYKEYYEPVKVAALILNHKNIHARMKKIDTALREYASISPRFYNGKKIGEMVKGFDLLVAGGDQIWNPMYPNYFDDAFYYYGIEGIRKIAYGSSVSVNDLTQSQIAYLRERIQHFDSVNVREKRTAELFLENHINDHTHYIMDPVFLPERSFYEEMISRAHVPPVPVGDRYILAYHLDQGPELDQIIQQVREYTGYRLISLIGNRKYWYSDQYIKDYGPYEFLWLIQHAQMVLTGSFHALCFSLQFKTPFMVQLPEKSPNRICNLLRELELNDRIITGAESIRRIAGTEVNPAAYEKLAVQVSASRAQLDRAITPQTGSRI